MRKKIITLIMSATLVASISMTSFAGQWQQDTTGWWYQITWTVSIPLMRITKIKY